MTDPASYRDFCDTCAHHRSVHIYEEGACRPAGVVCACEQFASPAPDLLTLHNRAEEAATTALEAAQARNREIVAAVGRGVRVRDVARLLDLSESRVHAIVKREGR